MALSEIPGRHQEVVAVPVVQISAHCEAFSELYPCKTVFAYQTHGGAMKFTSLESRDREKAATMLKEIP